MTIKRKVESVVYFGMVHKVMRYGILVKLMLLTWRIWPVYMDLSTYEVFFQICPFNWDHQEDYNIYFAKCYNCNFISFLETYMHFNTIQNQVKILHFTSLHPFSPFCSNKHNHCYYHSIKANMIWLFFNFLNTNNAKIWMLWAKKQHTKPTTSCFFSLTSYFYFHFHSSFSIILKLFV